MGTGKKQPAPIRRARGSTPRLCIHGELANTAMIDRLKDRRGYAAHTAWAVLAAVVTLLMIFTPTTELPIYLVLLPLVILIWVVGHLAIWGVTWLVVKGQSVAIETGSQVSSRPIGLTLAVIGTGILTFVGVFQILMTVYQGKLYPYHYANLWTTMLIIKLFHAACFIGLLLRQQWSRLATALLAIGWAILMASQIAEHLPLKASSSISDLMIAFGIMVSLIFLGMHLIVSDKAKSFMKN
ncbi:MAG: hypothetical protein SV375_16385 [Thermodesulfobacteriota bacterium]|nr:hypothetical protein [Thermodesulfobacteriota bacterium]